MRILPKTSIRKPIDVIIIGAGWAGLGAARCLQQQNIHSFWIVEGRDYVGGRSHTVTLSDGSSRAEVGSQWIQGANSNNPVYQAMIDSATKFCASNDDSTSAVVYAGDSDGICRVPDHEVERLIEDLFEGPSGFFEYQRALQDEGEVDRTLISVVDQFIEERGLSIAEIQALEWMLDSFIVGEYAASLEDLSHWWWDDDNELLGEDLYLAQDTESGFSNVVDHFSAPLRDKICLQRKVTSIDWSNVPVSVKVETTGCASDVESEIFARRVLLTVPLGVLQEGAIAFSPNLPFQKVRAINSLGMGLTNKVTMLWNSTDHLPWPQDKEWIERIDRDRNQGRWTEFFSPASLNGQPVLYAYISGRLARTVEENYTDEQIEEEVLASLTSMFGTITKPRQTLIQRWCEDEFSRGSYSYNRIGSTPKHRKALARPIKNRLYFAGEATHTKHFATVQGALLSGIAAAKQIGSEIKDEGRHKFDNQIGRKAE